MNIVMFGPPGSGKGTQGKKLAEEYGLRHVSFGDVLRDHVKAGTEIGIKVKEIMDKGTLVGVDIMALILQNEISSLKLEKGTILDGFPRNLVQAKLLDSVFEKNNLELQKIIYLEVPIQVSYNRIASRAKVEGRTDDTSIDKVNARLQVYHQETLPIIDFYRDKVKIHHIDASENLYSVYDTIKKSLID